MPRGGAGARGDDWGAGRGAAPCPASAAAAAAGAAAVQRCRGGWRGGRGEGLGRGRAGRRPDHKRSSGELGGGAGAHRRRPRHPEGLPGAVQASSHSTILLLDTPRRRSTSEVLALLHRLAPQAPLEKASIDEVYLDVTAMVERELQVGLARGGGGSVSGVCGQGRVVGWRAWLGGCTTGAAPARPPPTPAPPLRQPPRARRGRPQRLWTRLRGGAWWWGGPWT